MNYMIISEQAISLRRKKVRVLIEHNNLRRANSFDAPLAADIDVHMQAYGTALWSAGEFVEDAIWIEREESQFKDLYKAVIRAGVQALRADNATLSDVSDAFDTFIAGSDKSQHLSKLQAMAAASTAAQRDRFFLLCAFLFLSKTLGEDKS